MFQTAFFQEMSIISKRYDRFFSNFSKLASEPSSFISASLNRPFFIKDANKNHRNRLNRACQKTRFKNITNAHINRFGPP